MKISSRHFNILKNEIDSFLLENPGVIEQYETGRIHNAYKVKDLNQRFCFDLFSYIFRGKDIVAELYSYLNDDNIYTALKRIAPKLDRRF